MSSAKELYQWILEEYEKFKQGLITEEEYLRQLRIYEERIKSLEQQTFEEQELDQVEQEKGIARSTSIAGLRNQILKELRGSHRRLF